MSNDQHAARVNVADVDWIEFRTLAVRKRRSVADYLGELVRRELARASKQASDPVPSDGERPRRRSATTRVRLSDQELLRSLPQRSPKPPPWEA